MNRFKRQLLVGAQQNVAVALVKDAEMEESEDDSSDAVGPVVTGVCTIGLDKGINIQTILQPGDTHPYSYRRATVLLQRLSQVVQRRVKSYTPHEKSQRREESSV